MKLLSMVLLVVGLTACVGSTSNTCIACRGDTENHKQVERNLGLNTPKPPPLTS